MRVSASVQAFLLKHFSDGCDEKWSCMSKVFAIMCVDDAICTQNCKYCLIGVQVLSDWCVIGQ